jgi:beta-galactosidase/beta-glucuronidase
MNSSPGHSNDETHQCGYPRPQLQRDGWVCLNGPWRFLLDPEARYRLPGDILEWPSTIQVPFAPESPASGIADPGFHQACWYQRQFEAPPGDGPLWIHFGAVDYGAQVWVNDQLVGGHEGGHISFSLDVTAALRKRGPQVVTLRAEDDPTDLAKPRGKQDWKAEPHSIWYPRTTGIWQTVWLERLSSVFLQRVQWTPHLERWEIGLEVVVGGVRGRDDLSLRVRLSCGSQVLADDTYQVIQAEVHRRIAFSDPGIDDFRNELLWSPETPTLIDAHLQLWEGNTLRDDVTSYTALRSVGLKQDRFMLNGRPYYLRLVLDQGYWPETLMTAPTDEALRRDVELAKEMGFNGVRKHQKIEDPRFLYWADRLGLLVWEEMPSAYRFTQQSVQRLIREWTEVIERDYSHPCIVVWVPFNESWGVPDLAHKAAHQSCVQALYHLTRTLDPTRPVVGNDGWESTATDLIGIHDYDSQPARLAQRYAGGINLEELLSRRRPGGRQLVVDGYSHRDKPFVLTEFGGIAHCSPERADPRDWGYCVQTSSEDLLRHYQALLEVVTRLDLFAGFCYTQLTDTFQEVNGLLRADRTAKIPLTAVAAATRGDQFMEKEQAVGRNLTS